MNKVVLMGRLIKEPEVRYSHSDTPIAVVRYSRSMDINKETAYDVRSKATVTHVEEIL